MDFVVDMTRTPAGLRLDNPEDTRSFRVVVVGADPLPVLDPPLKHEEYLWIPVALIRELAAGRVEAAWTGDLEAMVHYASSKGWYDGVAEAIRGHAVRVPA